MEDILASIRRILNDDEAATPQNGGPQNGGPQNGAPQHGAEAAPGAGHEMQAGHDPGPAPDADDDVLELDQSMMVEAPLAEPEMLPLPVAEAEPAVVAVAPQPPPLVTAPPPGPLAGPLSSYEPADGAALPLGAGRGSELLAPESEAATLSAMGSLVRTLSAERQTQVHRGGPTIEDLVREEMRPLLKNWLDQHLPAMVERVVRSEMERLMGRVAP